MFYGVKYAGPVIASWAAHNENGVARGYRKARSISFDGPTLYSFATPVARYYRFGSRLMVLMLSDKFSPTTGQHMKAARYNVHVPVHLVNRIGMRGGWNYEELTTDLEMHQHNAKCMHDQMIALCVAAGKYFKDEQRDRLGACVYDLREQAQTRAAYCADVGLDDRVLVEEMIDKLNAAIAEARKDYYHPALVRRRELAAARRLARKAFLEDAR